MTTRRDASIASTDPGSRSADELEREVRESRADLERTLDAIQDRLAPGQLVDQVARYLRENGAEFAHNLGDTVKRNPVPAVLVGAGLAWMTVSGLRRDDGLRRAADLAAADDELDDDDRDDPVSWSAYEGGLATGWGGAEDDDDDSALSEAARRARAGLGEAADRTREGFAEAGGAAEQAAGSAKAKLGRLARGARARAAGVRAGVAHRAQRTGARARHYSERAREGWLETLHRHPLVLGAVGVAIGAAIGAALPPSRREDEFMGDTSDQLKQRAWAAGREEYAKAKATAGEAYAAAEAEAEQQGLSREGLEAAAEAAQHKVESVADAATEAARREADRQGLGGTGPGA